MELYDLLEREASRLQPDPGALDRVADRVRRRRRRRRLRAGALLVAVFLGGAGLARLDHSSTSTTTSAPPLVVQRVEIPLDDGVTDVTVDLSGDAWVPGFGVVYRLQAGTGAVLATIPVAGDSDYRYAAAGAGAVWITDTGTGDITRIDPATNAVVATIAAGGAPIDVAVGFEQVWVLLAASEATETGRQLLAIDPATNEPGIPLEVTGSHITIGSESVLLSGDDEDEIDAIDPESHGLEVLRPFRGTAVTLWGSGQSMWAASAGSLTEVDSQSLSAVGTALALHMPLRPIVLAVASNALWALQQPSANEPSQLQQIDPEQAALVDPPIMVGLTAVAVAATDDAVWIANFSDRTVTLLTVR